MMVQLTDLPVEIMVAVFEEVNPEHIGQLRQCCKRFDELFRDNPLLYRSIYLNTWDTPLQIATYPTEQWKEDLENFTNMFKILASADLDVKRVATPFVQANMIKYLEAAASDDEGRSSNVGILHSTFYCSVNREIFLRHSSTWLRAGVYKRGRLECELRSIVKDPHGAMMSAKVHCLFGAPSHRTWDKEATEDMYPFAASKVYDFRNYLRANLWGPFKDDGSIEVDWEKVEAVMLVLGHTFRQRKRPLLAAWSNWTEPFHGAFANSYVPHPELRGRLLPSTCPKCIPAPMPAYLEDPYGISGAWLRVVGFVNYNELFRYNYSWHTPPPGIPLPPLDTEEARRILLMDLVATKIDPPGQDDGQDLPVVSFKGVSHHLDTEDSEAHSTIRGTVRQTKEGEIRWTSFSIWDGEARWRSEGIQVGGIRSGRGVFGTWFEMHYNLEGPVGPSAFWKLYEMEGVNTNDDPDSDS